MNKMPPSQLQQPQLPPKLPPKLPSKVSKESPPAAELDPVSKIAVELVTAQQVCVSGLQVELVLVRSSL